MAEHTLTYRGTVYPWHCDQMGHMNVMWYVGKFDEATWQLFAAAGITPSYLRAQRRGMVAVDQRLSYRGELYAGDVISIRSAIIELGTSSVRFVHEMQRDETGEHVATSMLKGVHIDTVARRSCPLPEELRARRASWWLRMRRRGRAGRRRAHSWGEAHADCRRYGTGRILVQPSDTAKVLALSSEDSFPEVFATSRMIALMELAAARAMRPALQPGQLSVGVSLNVKHTAATPVGGKVRAVATYRAQRRQALHLQSRGIRRGRPGRRGRALARDHRDRAAAPRRRTSQEVAFG